MEKVEIGGTPCEETCAATGVTEDAQTLNRLECKAYIAALTRVFGEPPEGSRYGVSGNSHDFGTYYEVVFHYDPADPAQDEYAGKAENGLAKWAEADMWAPVLYSGSQPAHIIKDPALWERARNPGAHNDVGRRDERAAADAASA